MTMEFFHAFAFAFLMPVLPLHIPKEQYHHLALDEVKDEGNFVFTRKSKPEGFETFLSYNGIYTTESEIPSTSQDGLFYRQTTDGIHLIQMTYQGQHDLLGCYISSDKHEISTFYRNFLRSKASTESSLHTDQKLLGNLNDHLKILGDFKHHEEQCEAFMNQPLKSKLPEKPDNDKDTYSGKLHRSKRMAMIPGTKWCGTGNTASDDDELGLHSETDKCCRDHDKCPYMIPRFTTHYNLFNYRPYTISHCDCDVR